MIARDLLSNTSKAIVALLALAMLSSCTLHAPSQRYYIKSGERASMLSGELNGLTGDIKIQLDGKQVLQGTFQSFSDTLLLQDDYQGINVRADCKMMYCTNSIACFTYINEQPAALLEFGRP